MADSFPEPQSHSKLKTIVSVLNFTSHVTLSVVVPKCKNILIDFVLKILRNSTQQFGIHQNSNSGT